MPRLIVIKGADEGKQFELAEEHLGIGRDSANPVRLHDTEISRRHAELRKSADGFRLVDLGSANGTFVNNQSVRDVLLAPGDHVQVGQTVLVYTATTAAPSGVAPAQAGDLADRINLIARQDLELSSAIIKAVGEAEGSRILAHPDQVEGPWLKNALANLRVMYEATQAVSHILDLEQLLERVLELIFRHLDADRGCVMLRGDAEPGTEPTDSRNFQPKAARWRDGISRQEKIPVSRTIVDYVLKEKKGILISDAARDERFQAVQSIVRFGVREIICVPMTGRHETLGVLYLDTRTTAKNAALSGLSRPPASKFTGDHLELAMAIAHQASLALEETRYYQAMVQAERLAAVGQTIAALAHDVKNILQGLRSGSEILQMGLDAMDPELLRKGWKNIEKNQGRIYDLVMNMLSYSKEREPAIESTDLGAIVTEVVELLGPRAAEKQVRLELKLAPNLPPCPADHEAIHRAVLNIISNALDAVEQADKARVVVTTALASDGSHFRIQVRDNGVGIPPEKIGEIFRPFVSTKGARGTGLGLAVSRKVLREHGGDIDVQSQPGQGSLFTLRLPARSPFTSDVHNTSTTHPVLPPDVH